MKVKLNWLNELVDISDLSTEQLVETLSLHSTEIESVERVLKGTNLTIGHVLTCINHPDSDHLHICTVDCKNEVLQIVCGAPNIKENMDVIVALVNAELPGGIKIKRSKIRGVESSGMICSLQELGMEKKYIDEEYTNGIYYFKKKVEPGTDPLKELDFNDDVLELGLTPNRGDLLSMIGVAYEVSAILNRPMKKVAFSLDKIKKVEPNNKDLVSVKIKTDKCLTYHAKVIKDIKIKKSPDWLISRLIAFGIRPINNAVDITNYILALYGQPLHAFDYKLLKNTIEIRQAKENESIVTLDGIKRDLIPDDIVITDGVNPVALAGVMGGLNSSINDETVDIVIEAAIFDSIAIRKTYTRLDLRSESSVRFEKGVDCNRLEEALAYTCYLFSELADAKIVDVDTYAGIKNIDPTKIVITSEYISNYLGIKISDNEVIDILNRLQFDTKKVDNEIITLVPNRRPDIQIKADIVEEVGRVHGYEALPVTLPTTPLAGQLTAYQKNRRNMKHSLVDFGLIEVYNYSLRENNNEFSYLYKDNEEDIPLMHPISKERKVLRRSLIPSILENVSYSFNRKINDVAFFEIGKVYKKANDEYYEDEHLSIAMANNFTQTLWRGQIEKVDFYLLKGIVDQTFKNIGISFEYKKIDKNIDQMHPLRTASIMYKNKVVGYIGEIHPKYASLNDLTDVYVCEINLSLLLNESLKQVKKGYVPVSKVPVVERDLALVVKKDVSAIEIVNAIKECDKKMISDVIIFDVYSGEKVADDEKSIACKVILSSNETLTDDVCNNKINKILKTLENKLQATLRK